eukprot:4833369-Amphidinium_carterae.1
MNTLISQHAGCLEPLILQPPSIEAHATAYEAIWLLAKVETLCKRQQLRCAELDDRRPQGASAGGTGNLPTYALYKTERQ